MNKRIKNLIVSINNDKYLEECLNCNSFLEALGTLQEYYEDNNPFEKEYAFFNTIYDCIKNNNKEKFKSTLKESLLLYSIDMAMNIIEYQECKIEEFNLYGIDDYLMNTIILKRIKEIDDSQIDKIIVEIFDSNITITPKIEAVREVLDLYKVSEKENTITDFLEDLITSNNLSYSSLIDAIIYDDVWIFLDKYLLLKYLKEQYLIYQKNNLDILEEQIKRIRDIGLD